VKLLLDISHMSFNVGRPFERRLDDNGVQRLDRKTRAPLWSAQLVVMSADGADTINVTIAGEPPHLQQGQPVTPVELVAIPWARNGRDGVAYRAVEVRPLAAAAKAS
jgi:hypothetical protein